MLMEHIGGLLRRVRKQAGLTQAELAERLGGRQTGISRVELRADCLVSTFRKYVRAAGAEPLVGARFPDAAQ